MTETRNGETFDVAVVGAGPAACMAAMTLARKHVDVVMIEAVPLPRYKACGGGFTRRAVNLLSHEVTQRWERECRTVELTLEQGAKRFAVAREEPLVSTAMRSGLDLSLLCLAQEAGAEVWSPCRVSAVHHHGRHLEIATSNGALTIEYLIVADGATGTTAHHAGWSKPLATVPALEWEVEVAPETVARFADTAHFALDDVPQGYAWVFPKAEHLSVGMVSTRRQVTGLADRLAGFLKRLGIEPRAADRHGFVVANRPRREGLVKGRVLLVGDAAGLVDPLTAEGIYNALMSGRLAGNAIVEGNFDPWNVQYRYESDLEREVLGELRLGRVMADFLYRLPRCRRFVFNRHGQQVCEALADVVSGKRTYRDIMLRSRTYTQLLKKRQPAV